MTLRAFKNLLEGRVDKIGHCWLEEQEWDATQERESLRWFIQVLINLLKWCYL